MNKRTLVEDRLKLIFAQLFNGECGFSPDVENWDSVKHIELIFAIESEFGIQYDGEEASRLISGENILDSVTSKLLE